MGTVTPLGREKSPAGRKLSDFRRSEVGFERRCPMCVEWWPITDEFWDAHWMSRCRACIAAHRRDFHILKQRTDPAYRAAHKESARLNAWKERQNNPEAVRERKRAYWQEHRERILEGQRVRYHAHRERILARRRALKGTS